MNETSVERAPRAEIERLQDHFLPEVVDPETLEPVARGRSASWS